MELLANTVHCREVRSNHGMVLFTFISDVLDLAQIMLELVPAFFEYFVAQVLCADRLFEGM